MAIIECRASQAGADWRQPNSKGRGVEGDEVLSSREAAVAHTFKFRDTIKGLYINFPA